MVTRPRQTLVDYLVIGISPALIMGMVGSLLFFLLTILYHGQYGARLTFIFAMFTLAIVLIARISMENGIEYASLFAIPLAILTFLAMVKFAEIQGPLAPYSSLINAGFLAVVWWSAHKLTWDCTFIDDQQDASGEGLLQGMGFDADTVEQQVHAVQPREGLPSPANRPHDPTSAAPGDPDWYQRMVERRRRPHTPGVWVLYYALAALPLFGVGQWLLPATDVASRAHAFRLICVYVACALALLLTTSFLGLRRYLRQRHVPMPADMARVWLGLGATMIVAVLLACLVLPRPGATLSLSQLPFSITLDSKDHRQTSPHALGRDGTERTEHATATRPTKQPSSFTSEHPPTDQSPAGSGPTGQEADGAKRQAAPTASQSRTPPNSESPQPDAQHDPQQSGAATPDPDSGRASDDGPTPRDTQQPGGSEQARQAEDPAGDSGPVKPEPGQARGAQPEPEHDRPQPAAADRPPEPAHQQKLPPSSPPLSRSRPPRSPSQIGSALLRAVGPFLKLLLFVGLLCAALFCAWKYRAQVRQALAQLWRDLQHLWASLWGRRAPSDAASAALEQPQAEPPAPSFASYQDPFATGRAKRYTTEQLVCYTFAALEAWGREHGCARAPDQTPLEYAQRLAGRHAALGPDTHLLAELYCQLVYGRQPIAVERRTNLRRLWQHLCQNV